MIKEKFDFYDKTVLKSYDLDSSARYQLKMLDSLDNFTRKHSEGVANITCRICDYLHLNKDFTTYCTTCAYLHDIGRVKYIPITDDEAVKSFEYLSRMEGIIPAIESAHALSYAIKEAPKMNKDKIIVVNLSGRGDKDCVSIAKYNGEIINE